MTIVLRVHPRATSFVVDVHTRATSWNQPFDTEPQARAFVRSVRALARHVRDVVFVDDVERFDKGA